MPDGTHVSPPDLPRIRRTSLYEEVVSELQEFMLREGLRPGQKLPAERDLARGLGVSRTSVRQALTALRVMGLVEIRHGDGVYLERSPADVVPPIATHVLEAHPDLPALNEVREALEPQAALLAARRRMSEDVIELRRAIEVMEEEIGRGGHGIEGDWRFHEQVIRIAANPLLARIWEGLREPLQRISNESLSRPGQPPRSVATHRLILQAIERQDEAAAFELMREHLAVTGRLASR